VGYAGAAGFITNLGGLITMPVAIPANLASVLLIQLRMIAAIAILRGYQVSDPQVRTLAYVCLVGSGAADLLQEFSVELGRKLATGLIMKISGKTLTKINQAVGFKLVTKAGASGLVNLTRIVPVIGGLVGGGFDAFLTRGIGTAAKLTFTAIHPDDAQGSVARSTTTTIVTSDPGPLPASE
jgi:EcsC protein family